MTIIGKWNPIFPIYVCLEKVNFTDKKLLHFHLYSVTKSKRNSDSDYFFHLLEPIQALFKKHCKKYDVNTFDILPSYFIQITGSSSLEHTKQVIIINCKQNWHWMFTAIAGKVASESFFSIYTSRFCHFQNIFFRTVMRIVYLGLTFLKILICSLDHPFHWITGDIGL